ncbi:MAG TPA: SprT-like domain-containing protein [Chlamydiales bacterium]|nr:SprT-like domain-containing protein [Chlamydiales bacterium]
MMKWLSFFFPRKKTRSLQPAGSTYDLQAIYQDLKVRYFPAECTIGWAPSRAKRFRSITFGTYNWRTGQIRINRLLDDPDVPRYFVEFIVYHEMLHAVCPPKRDSAGRCRFHTAEFRMKEREFPHFEAAKEWEKISLNFFKKRKSHGRS